MTSDNTRRKQTKLQERNDQRRSKSSRSRNAMTSSELKRDDLFPMTVGCLDPKCAHVQFGYCTGEPRPGVKFECAACGKRNTEYGHGKLQ